MTLAEAIALVEKSEAERAYAADRLYVSEPEPF